MTDMLRITANPVERLRKDLDLPGLVNCSQEMELGYPPAVNYLKNVLRDALYDLRIEVALAVYAAKKPQTHNYHTRHLLQDGADRPLFRSSMVVNHILTCLELDDSEQLSGLLTEYIQSRFDYEYVRITSVRPSDNESDGNLYITLR